MGLLAIRLNHRCYCKADIDCMPGDEVTMQTMSLSAECHQLSQLNDYGDIGLASTEAMSQSCYPITNNPYFVQLLFESQR